MLFQSKGQNSNPQGFLSLGTIKKPAENQIHSWRSLEVQNLNKKTYRIGHTATLLGDNMIIIGGTKIDGAMREELSCLSFDLETQVCEKIEITGRDKKPLLDHSACHWKDNKFIVFGGCGRDYNPFSELGILTFSERNKEGKQTAQWETVETEIKLARYYHTAHIYEDKMFVIGGVEKKDSVKDLWYLDLNTWKWHKPADWLQPSQFGEVPEDGLPFHSSFLFENKVYVFAATLKKNPWHIFSVLNLDTLAWEDLNSERFPSMIRNSKCSQPINGHVYILGADEESSPPIKLWSYDIRQNIWNEIKQEGKSLAMRQEFTLTEYKDQLYIFGGLSPSRNATPANLKKPHLSTSGSFGLWAFSLGESSFDTSSQEQGTIPSQGALNLGQIMKKLLKDAPYSDITFEVESKEIPAHKWFLIKNSKYFTNMFSSGMIESKTSKIPIPDMKAKTFESFLEFLYSDDVKLNKEIALELLEVADKYSVPDLRVKCEEYLAKNFSVNNYVRIAKMADLVDSTTLRKAAIDYMSKNIRQLKSRPEFGEISDDYIREIIIKLTVR